MNTIKQILRTKGSRVWKVPADASVLDALHVMAERGTGSVVVMDNGRVAGIFTERDFARKVGLVEAKPSSIRIRDVMTVQLVTVEPGDTVNECMALMTEKRIRHLPVLEDGQLVGIISIGDVVKDIIEELRFMVKQLENYITGIR
jgi:CBS domain-containing protein